MWQVKRDSHTLARTEQDLLETKRENENLQTVIETLKQQNKNLQIEKDTEVEALSTQVNFNFYCFGNVDTMYWCV